MRSPSFIWVPAEGKGRQYGIHHMTDEVLIDLFGYVASAMYKEHFSRQSEL